jgi:hypothetical protein
MWYWLKRNEIGKKNKNNPNEQRLFHGSRNNAYDIILKGGFDHRVANMGGAIGGKNCIQLEAYMSSWCILWRKFSDFQWVHWR